MRAYRKWVMTLGIITMTPGLTMGGPLSFMKKGAESETAGNPAPRARRTNQQVAENVAGALKQAGLTGHEIDIEFKGGVLTLTGNVGSPAQKQLAGEVCGRIPEIKSVDNRLTPIAANRPSQLRQVAFEAENIASPPQIQPAAAPPAQQPAAPAQTADPIAAASAETASPQAQYSNQQVAEQIKEALLSAQLNGYDIEIRYQNGVATLAGAVSNPQQRIAAQQAVSRIPGVQSVNNRLTYPGAQQAAAEQQALAARQLAMAGYQPNGPGPDGAVPPGPGGPVGPGGAPPYAYGAPMGAQPAMGNPSLPSYAWPSYASYPNYAQVTYPQQYSASAWPYIGPFYPYPQVPLGWRQVQLEWDDGMWNLNFRPRTDRWWWFLNPKNW